MKEWTAEFKPGTDITKVDPRSGCPKSSTPDKQLDVIHCIHLNNKRLTVQQIAMSIDISYGSVYNGILEMSNHLCKMGSSVADTRT